MNGRNALLAIAVALVAVLAFVAWRALGAPPPEPGPVGLAADRAQGSAAGGSTAVAVEPGLESAGSARTIPGRMDGAPPRLVLRVVDARSGEKVGGARVRWAPSRRGLTRAEAEELLDRDGIATAASEAGALELELAETFLAIDARAGDLWGLLCVEVDPASTVELALAPDRDLEIHTVDPQGRPMPGLPVAVRSVWPPRGEDPLWIGRTSGDRATARLRHLDSWLEEHGRVEELAVSLDVPTRDSVVARVDPRLPMSAPVRLAAPWLGSLEVLVRDPPGATIEGARVRLVAAGDARGTATAFFRPQPLEQGRAVYPFVETGLEFDLRAEAFGGWRPVQVRGPGPAAPGEVARIELAFGERCPGLLGRLVDASGAPLAGRRIHARARRGEGGHGAWVWSAASITLADGAFRIFDERGAPESCDELQVDVLDESGALEGSARARLPRLDAGDVDLGTLTVRAAPFLVAGVVVDEADSPVEGAGVRLECVRPPEPGETLRTTVEPLGSARCREDGSFELRGDPGPGELRLQPFQAGFAPGEKTTIAAGARGVRLFLRRAGAIEGEIRIDSGAPAEAFEVEAETRAISGQGPRRSTAKLRRELRFRLEPLAPGEWMVAVRFAGDPEPLRTVEGVRVSAGETTRLEPVDLRGSLRVCRIAVQDPDGIPVPAGRVRCRAPESSAVARSFPVSRGLAFVPLRGPRVDLEIDAPGFRREVLESVDGDRTVRLQRGYALRLRLAGAGLPSAPLRLSASLSSGPQRGPDADGRRVGPDAAGRAREASRSTVAFGADGDARFLLREPGEWRIELLLQNEGRPGEVRWVRCSPASLAVDDSSREEIVVVTPSVPEWDAAIRELR